MRPFLALVLTLLTASAAAALMPPHVTSVSPGSGGALVEGRIVKFHGYSLEHGADPTARDAQSQEVRVETFLWTRRECAGGPCGHSTGPVAAGSEQIYSVLSVKLPPVSPGARYEVTLLGTSVQVIERDGSYIVE